MNEQHTRGVGGTVGAGHDGIDSMHLVWRGKQGPCYLLFRVNIK